MSDVDLRVQASHDKTVVWIDVGPEQFWLTPDEARSVATRLLGVAYDIDGVGHPTE